MEKKTLTEKDKSKIIDLAIDIFIIKKLLKLELITESQYNRLKKELYAESKCGVNV